MQTTCLTYTLVYHILLRMIQSGLSRYTMEERDLCPIDFKHALYVKQLMMMVSFSWAHTLCESRESSPRTSTVLPLHLTLSEPVHLHTSSSFSGKGWRGVRSLPPLKLETPILKGREGFSSPVGAKSHLECLQQSALFLAVHVSFRFALEEMINKRCL